MRIDFNDGGYIEFTNSKSGKLFIIVSAKNDDRTRTVNSAEITHDQLDELLSDIQFNDPGEGPQQNKEEQ